MTNDEGRTTNDDDDNDDNDDDDNDDDKDDDKDDDDDVRQLFDGCLLDVCQAAAMVTTGACPNPARKHMQRWMDRLSKQVLENHVEDSLLTNATLPTKGG